MPDYRETIVRIDHDTGVADVWTPYPAVRRLMERVGAEALDKQIKGQWWRVQAKVLSRGIRFGKSSAGQGGKATGARLAALAKARATRGGAKS
jgi:hypothetical protein